MGSLNSLKRASGETIGKGSGKGRLPAKCPERGKKDAVSERSGSKHEKKDFS